MKVQKFNRCRIFIDNWKNLKNGGGPLVPTERIKKWILKKVSESVNKSKLLINVIRNSGNMSPYTSLKRLSLTGVTCVLVKCVVSFRFLKRNGVQTMALHIHMGQSVVKLTRERRSIEAKFNCRRHIWFVNCCGSWSVLGKLVFSRRLFLIENT